MVKRVRPTRAPGKSKVSDAPLQFIMSYATETSTAAENCASIHPGLRTTQAEFRRSVRDPLKLEGFCASIRSLPELCADGGRRLARAPARVRVTHGEMRAAGGSLRKIEGFGCARPIPHELRGRDHGGDRRRDHGGDHGGDHAETTAAAENRAGMHPEPAHNSGSVWSLRFGLPRTRGFPREQPNPA